MSVSTQQPQTILQTALAWLVTPPSFDSLADLELLKRYLKHVAGLQLQPLQRLSVLNVFQDRVSSANSLLKPGLAEATVPLSHQMRSVVRGLTDVHNLMASGILISIREIVAIKANVLVSNIQTSCVHALRHLAEQQQIAAFASMAVPDGHWLLAQEAFGLLEMIKDNDTSGAEETLKGMFALAALQPESFPAAELAFLIKYLRTYATAVDVRRQPAPTLEAWYWLEKSRDLAPIACIRKPPPSHGTLIYFSCATLGRIVSQHVTQLDNGEPIDVLGLTSSINIPNVREVLRRAQARWLSPGNRQSHRRPNHYRVEICCQFSRIWQLIRGEAQEESGMTAPTTEWMALNESPGGLALMHIAGTVTELWPGDILAARPLSALPWSIYLIRWVRSDNPEHYELGAELISTSPLPVQIIYPRIAGAKPAHAFLCPPMTGIERNEALLTANHPDDDSFILLNDRSGHIQVTESHVGRFVLQTGKVAMFEVNRSPSSDR